MLRSCGYARERYGRACIIRTSADESQLNMKCLAPSWKTYDDLTVTEPADGTVAIFVDMDNSQGAVYIHERGTDDYVDIVGQNLKGHKVIVPWKAEWQFICYGFCRVGLVTAAEVEAAPSSQEVGTGHEAG